MRVLLSTIGSRGDVQLILALAVKLKSLDRKLGCDIVLHGLGNPDAIESEFRARCMYSSADMRSTLSIDQMLAAFGPIDILINNAVVRHVAAIESLSAADWDEDLAVNLSAAFHTIPLALPGMKTQNWGRIINVSSIYGLVGAANRAPERRDITGAAIPIDGGWSAM